jgi:hypothetical protein
MKTNATTSIWRRTPMLDARFRELLHIDPKLTYTAIAQRLSVEFGVRITKNSCIGHGRRTGVPKRQPPRSYAGRLGRRLKPRPRSVPKLKPTPRAKPRPAKLRIWQLEPNECRWPIDSVSPFFFCAAPRASGSSYCPAHTHVSCPASGRRE